MKILKEGRKFEYGKMRHVCMYCKSVLEIESVDLLKKETERGSIYVYTCPCCSNKNLIAMSELPKEMQFELECWL